MSKTRLLITLSALSSLCVTLAGCNAPAPSRGDLMIKQGGPLIEAGIKWNEGNRLVKEGNKTIAEGRDTINEGKKMVTQGELQVSQGQSMIERGKKLIDESENLYQSGNPATSYPSYQPPQPTESVETFPLGN